MPLPVFLTVCFNFLFLWASEIGANVSNSADVCRDIEFFLENPDLDDDIENHSRCLLYTTNVLNCSWSLDRLQAAQIGPQISVCDNETLVQSWNNFTRKRVGSASFSLRKVGLLYVVLQFDIALQDNRTVYTKVYDYHSLEVPPPPGNISASLKDENLLVTWALPESRISSKPSCFQYQLDIGDGEADRNISKELSYTVANVDPGQAYRVRMRASLREGCQPYSYWSEWSPVAVVEPSGNHPSWLVIVLILLGTPMMLLALLLLVRYQRVCKAFFPPIPRPPPKYLYFLEKNDGFNIGNFRTPVEEEVTTVVLCD